MALPALRLVSFQEYLDLDAASDEKIEYVDGAVYTMAGGSRAHARLSVRLAVLLDPLVRPCRVYSSDLRIQIPALNRAYYADVSVVCGQDVLAEGPSESIVNPALVVEVLSPSTEAIDRGEKFAAYATLPSLKDYLLVASTQAALEHYERLSDGAWKYRRAGAGERIQLSSGVVLSVDEVFEGVELAPAVR